MARVNRIETPTTGEIFLMTRPAYYFGYGPESDPDTVCEIVDRDVQFETGVIAVEAELFVQEIDQVPDKLVEDLGGQSPQSILANSWATFTDQPFSTYALRRSGGRSDIVEGTLYELDIDDVDKLIDWNLAHHWRTWLDLELVDGRKAETLTITLDQAVDRQVAGIGYDAFLMGKDITRRVVQSFAEDY